MKRMIITLLVLGAALLPGITAANGDVSTGFPGNGATTSTPSSFGTGSTPTQVPALDPFTGIGVHPRPPGGANLPVPVPPGTSVDCYPVSDTCQDFLVENLNLESIRHDEKFAIRKLSNWETPIGQTVECALMSNLNFPLKKGTVKKLKQTLPNGGTRYSITQTFTINSCTKNLLHAVFTEELTTFQETESRPRYSLLGYLANPYYSYGLEVKQWHPELPRLLRTVSNKYSVRTSERPGQALSDYSVHVMYTGALSEQPYASRRLVDNFQSETELALMTTGEICPERNASFWGSRSEYLVSGARAVQTSDYKRTTDFDPVKCMGSAGLTAQAQRSMKSLRAELSSSEYRPKPVEIHRLENWTYGATGLPDRIEDYSYGLFVNDVRQTNTQTLLKVRKKLWHQEMEIPITPLAPDSEESDSPLRYPLLMTLS